MYLIIATRTDRYAQPVKTVRRDLDDVRRWCALWLAMAKRKVTVWRKTKEWVRRSRNAKHWRKVWELRSGQAVPGWSGRAGG